jgi:hypothetical protein
MIFYSVHFNRPDFIEIQKKCIDSIEGKLVIIKNSSDDRISEKCKEFGIKMYELENNDSPSVSHGKALNFISGIIDYQEDWCIIDHDFFPLRKIDFSGYEILGLLQEREGENSYLWPGFMAGKNYININSIDFLPTLNKDTGSGTSSLVSGPYKIKKLSEEYIGINLDCKFPLQTQKVLVKFEDFGIHYLNGSGWMETDQKVENEKNKLLLDTIKSISPINLE